MIDSLIESYRSRIDGELSDKARVVDQLLDVRLAAADRPAVVAVTDRLLAEIPGITTVPNAWWEDALDDLEAALDAIPAAHGA